MLRIIASRHGIIDNRRPLGMTMPISIRRVKRRKAIALMLSAKPRNGGNRPADRGDGASSLKA